MFIFVLFGLAFKRSKPHLSDYEKKNPPPPQTTTTTIKNENQTIQRFVKTSLEHTSDLYKIKQKKKKKKKKQQK